MRALVIEDGRVHLRTDLPAPVPAPDETLVAVRATGVCATDLALVAGYMGFSGVPGHEFVGVAQDGPLAGRRVVGEINAGCGTCDLCLAGDPRHCAGRTVLGIVGRPGAFAEELCLPTVNLTPVPDGVPDEAAVFTEPLAAALRITEQLGRLDDQRAVVAGDGRLGLLCAHALSRAGAEVTVAGRHPERAHLLPPGARLLTGLLEGDEDPRHPSSSPFDLAVEATGHPEVLGRLAARVRPRGTVVVKTTSERAITLDLAPFVVHELRLVGSRCGRFGPALEALAEGTLPVVQMIDARYGLDQGPAALEHAARPGVLKVLVDVSPASH